MDNVEHMWEQVKRAMVESASVWLSARRWEPKMCGGTIKRKEDAWKVLGPRDEDARERCLEVWKSIKRKRERLKGGTVWKEDESRCEWR